MGTKKGRFAAALWLVVALLAGRGAAAPSTGIEVLSRMNHVIARLTAVDSYDVRSESPLRMGLSQDFPVAYSPWPYAGIGTAASANDDGSLGAVVSGLRGLMGYDPTVPEGQDNRIPGPAGTGWAEATITFRPVGNFLAAEHAAYCDGLGYDAVGTVGIRMDDITAGTLLAIPPDTDPYGGFFAEYRVDPSHVYRATVWAQMETAIDPFFFSSNLRLYSYAVIPAPGAVLLAGIGLGLLGWLRRGKCL